MRGILAGLLLALLSASAWALKDPTPVAQDPRVQTVPYDENNPVSLHLVAGNAAEVEISPDERITNVFLSDSSHLKKAISGNAVFFKALLALPPQPAFIESARPDGSKRIYRLITDARDDAPFGATPEGKSLVSLDGGSAGTGGPPSDQRPITVRFTYAADEAKAKGAARAEAARQRQARAATRVAAARLAQPAAVVVNAHYEGQADAAAQEALAPDATWDDGQSTYFRFDGNRRLPVPYVLNPDGKEAVVDYTVKDRTIIIHQTASRFRLRDGDLVLCIVNPTYNAAGFNPGTGTTRPDVVRSVTGSPAGSPATGTPGP